MQLHRVKVVEAEKDGLEGPKNEAMEYLNLENEIVCNKNRLYQKYMLVVEALVLFAYNRFGFLCKSAVRRNR